MSGMGPELVEGRPGFGQPRVFGAIDIGASGGRVMAGIVHSGAALRQAQGTSQGAQGAVAGRGHGALPAADQDGPTIELVEIHRFPNGADEFDGHLRWRLTGLYEQILTGLTKLADRYPQTESVGIDTWAVDYGALDADGNLVAEPVAYRDARTEAVIDSVHRAVTPAELYAVNGLQYLPFNTIYQLAAEKESSIWPQIEQVLLIPDLIAYWLSGARRTEVTNASTTGLLDATTRKLSDGLLKQFDIGTDLFPPLIEPGTVVGTIAAEVADRTGLATRTTVVAVGSHDTASAVVGVPATARDYAYVSSGTWSLVGVELDQPVLTWAARSVNFTNEGGVDGRVRFLRNVGGLWLLQESVRTWREAGDEIDLDALLAEAAELPSGGPTIDVDSEVFIPPGDMPQRIRSTCVDRGVIPPQSRAALVRCILDSLAVAYARTVAQAAELSGLRPRVIHIVGGGSRNDLLCQLTADLSGLPVVSGPVEATALGNLVVQARTAGALAGDLEQLRETVRRSSRLRRYQPTSATDPALSSSLR
jgi:rhamnulokinase